MSRSSQDEAAKKRATVVAAASRLIRRKGIDGVGVRELMASAGLTQGAFVGQFGSKEALASEACALAFEGAERAWTNVLEGGRRGQAQRLAEYYLSAKAPEFDCPTATLSIDSSRSPAGGLIRQTFTHGLDRLARLLGGDPPAVDRLTLLAAMVGAAVLRKATDNERLADEIEAAVIHFSRTVA